MRLVPGRSDPYEPLIPTSMEIEKGCGPEWGWQGWAVALSPLVFGVALLIAVVAAK